ncbi:MAG: protein kinase [Planctomycetes bacterium]|nr:protein kinase [Planctomycetota bacterium]
MLGKGGMGEVYRADDLKLRQPVALKFLPAALSKDARRLERFHHEVRVARQVSHPNVCRVYDINEADGQAFISMEYIDGEDLASILRRMGRPSKDKALQIARQLCAGLAAAHDKGVLHRDLKPQNVMIDGQGRVRITDFGLAGFVDQFTGGEIRAGTPAYMAPEQLAGREVSVKSDIYSLGLVLFELFTGQRAFEGATRERLDRTRSSLPTSLSSIVEEIDPAVERVILRCLETEPAARPSSALAVAAALPGGDPLAAALAAGETPDPAMVAAGGEVGGLRPAIAIPCLLGVLVGMVAVAMLNDSTKLFRQVSLPKPPQVLADRASEIVKKLGHTDPVIDSAFGFARDNDYLRYIEENDDSPARWEKLASNRPPAIYFWYRHSPRQMIPPAAQWNVSLTQPPLDISGMSRVILDPEGRLIELNVVPPQKDDSAGTSKTSPSTDWSALFAEAQLNMADFTSADPTWNPAAYCAERAAWEGNYPDQPQVALRVEAGAYRGKPTFFKIIGPWTRAIRMEEAPRRLGQQAAGYAFISLILLILIGSVIFAWRNLKLRRGDRTGAFRFSFVVFLAGSLRWVLGTRHVLDAREFGRFVVGMGIMLFFAGWLWILYIAVEPYVRRRWPQTLIAWTRLLAGRLRDPLVGRDILVGGLFGISFQLLDQLQYLAQGWLGPYPPILQGIGLETLLGGRHLAASLINPFAVLFALLNLFILFVLRVILRKQWLVVLVFLLIFTTLTSLGVPPGYHGSALLSYVMFAALGQVAVLVVLMRFGLLALVAAFMFSFLLGAFPITVDFSTWYAGGSLLAMLAVVAVAGYGFHTALAGRPLFRDELLET